MGSHLYQTQLSNLVLHTSKNVTCYEPQQTRQVHTQCLLLCTTLNWALLYILCPTGREPKPEKKSRLFFYKVSYMPVHM